jgi:membrane-bound lytic murein transglycosylase D
MMNPKLLFACPLAVLCMTFTTMGASTLPRKAARTSGDTTEAPSQITTKTVAPNVDALTIIENEAVNAKMIRLNPRALTFVSNYMIKNKGIIGIKEWGLPYLNLMDKVLQQHGLPVELKYLAVIESKLKSKAVSGAGAAGPWQLMPVTARNLGLVVNSKRDERLDYYKSTNAAAKYLKYLFSEFDDWLLVIAAYNGGPGWVYSAIKKSKSRNFWDLQYFLPEESRNHVKKFISTHYIFEGQGSITTLTKAEATEQIGSLAGYLMNRQLSAEELNNSRTTTIAGKYRAEIIAKYVNMDNKDFNRYNPMFDKIIAGGENTYDLKLPSAQMELFLANKYPILNESVQALLNGQDEDDAEESVPAEVAAIKMESGTAIK